MHRLDIPQSMNGLRRLARRLSQPGEEVDRPPKETLRPEFIAKLKRLDLRAKVLLQGFLQGLHRNPRKGFSAEFSDYRTFTQGDDARWIDWRVFARTDRLYVKRFEAESALRATLVVDCSASMGYRSGRSHTADAPAFTKLGYAVTLAAALAYLLQSQRDRVGLFCIGGKHDDQAKGASTSSYLPPRSSKHHVTRVLQVLSALRASEKCDVPSALSELAGKERRRGLIVFFSDGLYGRSALLDSLRRLRHRGHELVFFQVWDPAELDPPVQPGASFRDPETLARYQPLPRDEYRRRAHEHLGEIRHGCLGVPCDHQFLLTTTAFDRSLIKFLKLRRRKH
ncbi:MAG: DUF58 domain-containing protein [Planctomycetota bacterium]|nr:DUF58 domain-containing protein [Planctomycetota bacterium]